MDSHIFFFFFFFFVIIAVFCLFGFFFLLLLLLSKAEVGHIAFHRDVTSVCAYVTFITSQNLGN